ncbi:MAG: amidase [Epsilonproteobacteria bacterium]|nr:MAG: amidase [Campylobacterota bacterium]RLA66767.1 MAG: amidase [Campylobacterota bacterium]
MTKFSEYESFDGLGLAELINKKEITKKEVLDAAIDRAEKWKKINAIIFPMHDMAFEHLKKDISGPFNGVPTLLKDLIADYKGTPITSGSKSLKDHISVLDSELVKRFKKAGVVIFGKTNAPEFGIMGTTEPEFFGPTLNPWDQSRSSGGSSGGSAAAVAAGIVPFAHGGDGGGSIRIPSSNCGLFGLKPTRGRNPTGPLYGEILDGAVVEHILSRSVRDSAAMLDCTNGPELGAPYNICPPDGSYLKALESDVPKLKIGYSVKSIMGGPIHQDVVKAILDTVILLKDLGHEVQEISPEVDGEQLANSYLVNLCAHVGADLDLISSKLSKYAAKNEVELITKTLGLIGRNLSATEFVRAKRYWHEISLSYAKFHEKYDLHLTPVGSQPPVLLGSEDIATTDKVLMGMVNSIGAGKLLIKTGRVKIIAKESFDKLPFTQMANLSGNPSMSVPLFWGERNLPIGSMFSAKSGDEMTLFKLAGQLEKARPWFDKRPSLK